MENKDDAVKLVIENYRKLSSQIYESFTKIDSVFGRRLAVIEVQIDKIERELREQNTFSRKMLAGLLEELQKKDEKMTANEMLAAIKDMDNGERWTLLNGLYDEYYNKGKQSKAEIDEEN